MSKTYKHQLKYKHKVYQRDSWFTSPKDINEPDDIHWGYWADDKSKQFIEKMLQRKFRHKVKRMIHQGDFDNLPLKPEDSAWILW